MIDITELTAANFGERARIQMVFSDTAETGDRGTPMPGGTLAQAVRKVIEGEPGLNFKAALILWREETFDVEAAARILQLPQFPKEPHP